MSGNRTAPLPELVADAIFSSDDGASFGLGSKACERLATVALGAVRAQGWRIVKTGEDGVRHGSRPHVAILEEWTG